MSEMLERVAAAMAATEGFVWEHMRQSEGDVSEVIEARDYWLSLARTTIGAVQDIVAEQLMKKCGGACAGAFEGIIDEALK